MASNSDSKAKKVFDVASPGRTAASASARPLIVGHKTTMQDPMVKEASVKHADVDEEPSTAPELELEDKPTGGTAKSSLSSKLMKPSSIKIEPLEKKESESDDKPSDETLEKKSDKRDTEASTSSDSATIDALAEQAQTKKQSQKDQQEITTKNAELEKLTAEKKYFVPIGEKKHQRSMRRLFLAIIIVLLLAALLGDLLIDVGIIKTSIKPPIRVFQSN